MAISRRRSTSTDEAEETRSSRRGSSREDAPAERPTRRRTASTDSDDEPTRSRSRASRQSSTSDDDEGSRSPRRKGTSGFGSYSAKKRSTSNFAAEFKPDDDKPTLIKFLEPGPFDTYNQHWIEEGNAAGKTRHSFVCIDDEEYFGKKISCPLCEIGDNAQTQALFNILDLSIPSRPTVFVWRASPVVADKLERLATAKRTQPLDRVDLYFEVTRVKKKNKVEWDIQPLKADEVEEEFDFAPLDEDELAGYVEKKFDDRTAVTKVDSLEDLEELADSLD